MTTLLLALSVFLGSPQAGLQQDGWSETSFHRVHLRNGNFIDGKVIADKPGEVILLLKSGEMSIRRDQVDAVEIVRVRSINEKPIILDTPKAPSTPSKNPAVNPNNPLPVVDTPEAVRKKVDLMIFKLKTSSANEKEFSVAELSALGEEAAPYLASKLPTMDVKLLNPAGAALINLKPTPRVVAVLESLISSESAPVRDTAATVLVITGGEGAKAKYLRSLVKDPDPKVRESALGLLGVVDDADWYDAMIDLVGDPNKDVRTRALRNAKSIAAKQGTTEAFIRSLTNQLNNADAGVRSDIVLMIGGLGVKEAWRQISGSLNDSEASVRSSAAQALMTLSVPESGEAIVTAMWREQDRWSRIYLAGTAQKLQLQTAVEPLISWLSAGEEDIRKVAAASLRTITGQDFGFDQAKWSEWFQTRKK